ncbi:MAG: hypothetical protein J0M18_14645 [Ignavibacteria bacterium]|jgi:hypothetical protein|nr:hypothetical protein [Ignavibacteria bacterium]
MKNKVKQFAAALIVAIFTAVSIFGMTSKSDAKISKTYKPFYVHVSDSTDGNGDDTTDGSGGSIYPTKE